MKRFVKIFCVGGGAYTVIELLWRGRSHWSMFMLGGTCFHLIGSIGNRLRRCGLLTVAATCAGVITIVEYISGRILNKRLKLCVWDYSNMPLNLHGQVCLLYSALWGMLSVIALPLYCLINKKGKVI